MSEQVTKAALVLLSEATEMSSDARVLAAAALEGRERLIAALPTVPGAVAVAEPGADAEGTTGAGPLYLTRVSVCGFRGVAGRLDLELQPAPGLVLITGRNGSGKSSIAEGAEVALSGRSYRSSSTLWSRGLTNLHHDGNTEVEIGLRVDGSRDIRVGCRISGSGLAGATRWAKQDGETLDAAVLGWDDAVVRYRPVLTYNELAALTSAKPSELYDPINNILGLDGLTAADRALTQAATDEGRTPKAANAARKELVAALEGSDDPRAAELRAALKGSKPNVETARAVLLGTVGAAAGSRQALATWTALTPPDPDRAREVVARLDEAVQRHRRVAAGAAGRAKRLADLLELAMAHREHDGDPCPVCGQGRLDDAWLTEAQTQAEVARREAAEAEAAEAELRAARTAARRLVTPPPTALNVPETRGVDPAAAVAAWGALADLDHLSGTDDVRDRVLLAGVVDAVVAVEAAVTSLAAAASDAVISQDVAWQPLAEQAGETLNLMDKADAATARLAAIAEAREWLNTITTTLRDERLARFAHEATGVWEGLRQDSNVALGGIRLVGANTRREVQLDLTVDGTPGPQAVLSQGELAALGLALFLPRSTAEDSPFRFIVIDDPVQSMDPSKIDGLARVLHHLAETRQVIVFTHDDRLIQALRRLALPATNYRIDRGERSAVSILLVDDPVNQHLRDADALAKDSVLPADLLAIAVSGYCRDALDEAAIDLARRRLLAGGASVADVDAALESAGSSRGLLALAMLGDPRKNGSPLDRVLTDQLGRDTRDVVTACVEGVHEAELGPPSDLLAATRALVAMLLSAA